MALQIKKAVKYDAKGRVALIGPGGSGKSMTALKLARLLAGPTGKILAVDTEHGSLSKYAPGRDQVADNITTFDFEVIEPDVFSPAIFMEALTLAETGGYDVCLFDSLSHFWMGKGGALEYVDDAKKLAKSRSQGRVDDMAGWAEFRPHERAMVDGMIASPCHIICTMRVKTAYEEQTDERGRKKRVKIGLAPVQREGLEYEFDLVGAMNDENDLVIDKTRCSHYRGKVLSLPGDKDFQPFVDWLKGEKKPEPVIAPAPVAPAAPAPTLPHQAAPPAEKKPAAIAFASVPFQDRLVSIKKMFGELPDGDVKFIAVLGNNGYDAISAVKEEHFEAIRRDLLTVHADLASRAQKGKAA